jgi:hypothetical protein
MRPNRLISPPTRRAPTTSGSPCLGIMGRTATLAIGPTRAAHSYGRPRTAAGSPWRALALPLWWVRLCGPQANARGFSPALAAADPCVLPQTSRALSKVDARTTHEGNRGERRCCGDRDRPAVEWMMPPLTMHLGPHDMLLNLEIKCREERSAAVHTDTWSASCRHTLKIMPSLAIVKRPR